VNSKTYYSPLPAAIRVHRFHHLDWSSLLGTAMLLTLAAAVAYSLAWTVDQHDDFQQGDYGAYYRAGRAVATGNSPYVVEEHGPTETFVYAPAYAFLFQPIAGLDYLWGARVWMAANWCLTAACAWLGLNLILGSGWRERAPWAVLWLAMVPLANFFWANIRSGQAGIVVLACCLGWAVCRQRGRSFVGGILLAAACAIKTFPVLLLPYLLVRRDFRGLAGVLAGSLLLFLAPAAWVGWSGTVLLHQEWPRHCLATQIAAQTVCPANQSVLGLLGRLPWVSNGGVCYSWENLHALEQNYVLIVLALASALYGMILWVRCRTPAIATAERVRSHENLDLAVLFVFMTLTQARGWTCNFVTLLPGCFFLAGCVAARVRRWHIALLGLALVTGMSTLHAYVPENGDWLLMAWVIQAKFFWAGVVLAVTCWSCQESVVGSRGSQ
jgi:hypothetical protein